MNSNPQRGCGTKKENAYYLESDRPGPNGRIWAWTWLFGDPANLPLLDVPARLTLVRNIAATILLAEHIDLSPPFIPTEEERDLYLQIVNSTRDVGVVDHIGKQYYTAFDFAEEVNRLGPSRRTTKETAKLVSELIMRVGPIPILFTHPRIPVFHDDGHIEEFIELATPLFLEEEDIPDWSEMPREPLWQDPTWGMYKRDRDQHPGHNHIGREILEAFSIVEKGLSAERAERPEWLAMAKFIRALPCAEQMFGLSFLHRVTYTLPSQEPEGLREKIQEEIPGVEFLDLRKEFGTPENVQAADEEE